MRLVGVVAGRVPIKRSRSFDMGFGLMRGAVRSRRCLPLDVTARLQASRSSNSFGREAFRIDSVTHPEDLHYSCSGWRAHVENSELSPSTFRIFRQELSSLQ